MNTLMHRSVCVIVPAPHEKGEVGIGVPNTAAKGRRLRKSRGFFHALVRLFSGGRAGGAARPAGAVPVRQLPFRSPTRLASCGRVQTATRRPLWLKRSLNERARKEQMQ